jgi:regulator of sirC expression with transglutaminase-like and TPR domain
MVTRQIPNGATMNTATALETFGRDLPDGTPIDTRAYGPWFYRMAQLTLFSDEKLGGLDIGALNLECAVGLPGAKELNIGACVRKLNDWASQVRAFTEANWPMYLKSPSQYDNSPAQFRMLALVTYLQKHLGVKYNLSFSEGDYNATDSRNLFVHGILGGHGGTCVTMPVLYIAIGRRLGYPLKLVIAKEHLFARWEEPGGERFNIECTSPGFRAVNDEYYHNWPKPLSPAELRSGWFLRSLRPREELAEFINLRARCLMDHLQLYKALQSCFLAGQLTPKSPFIQSSWIVATVMFHALERARIKAGLKDYRNLDLRWVYIPDGKEEYSHWAVPIAREDLRRIARIHDKLRAEARNRKPAAGIRAGGSIIAGAGF